MIPSRYTPSYQGQSNIALLSDPKPCTPRSTLQSYVQVCEPRPPELSLHFHTRDHRVTRHQQRPKCPSLLREEIGIIQKKAKSDRQNAKNKADSAKRGLKLNPGKR